MLAIISGADSSFDLLNYHLFNGWRTFDLGGRDYLPTSIWTFFPSALDAIYYLFWKLTTPTTLNFFIGGFQGLIGFSVYRFVRQFENNKSAFSTKSFAVGVLALSSPITRSQFGSSLGDLTLVTLEIFLFTKIATIKVRKKSTMPLMRLAILLGLILALKPAHVCIVVTLGLFSIYHCSIKNKIKFTSISVSSFIVFSFPWWLKAFISTGSWLFPYVSNTNKEILSSRQAIYSYESWVINSIPDLFRHLLYPGGGPSINSEIPFVDFVMPAGVIILGISLIMRILKYDLGPESRDKFLAGQIALTVGLFSFTLNQIIFTGVRYSLATYSLLWLGLGLIALSGAKKISRSTLFIVFLVFTLNTFRPETIYYPLVSEPKTAASVPDFGRTRGAYLYNPSRDFTPPYLVRPRDTVLFGQEQTSFLGPLWGVNAQFVGLQAFILGKDAKREISTILEAATQNQQKIYLVALSVNLTTEEAQLASVTKNFEIVECLNVENPYQRTLSMCKVEPKVKS
jgi:hypothetical protein